MTSSGSCWKLAIPALPIGVLDTHMTRSASCTWTGRLPPGLLTSEAIVTFMHQFDDLMKQFCDVRALTACEYFPVLREASMDPVDGQPQISRHVGSSPRASTQHGSAAALTPASSCSSSPCGAPARLHFNSSVRAPAAVGLLLRLGMSEPAEPWWRPASARFC